MQGDSKWPFTRLPAKVAVVLIFPPLGVSFPKSLSAFYNLQSMGHSREKIIIMVFGCSLLLFSQSLTEYSNPMKQVKIYSLHQAPSFRVRNCMVWGRGWEGTLCSGGKDKLYATSPARSELRSPNPLVRKKIILPDTSPSEVHCTVILPCLRRKCFIRLSSRKLDPEGTGTERAHFNLGSRLPRRIWVWEQNPEGESCMDPSPDGVRRDREEPARSPSPWDSFPWGMQGFSGHDHPSQ